MTATTEPVIITREDTTLTVDLTVDDDITDITISINGDDAFYAHRK